MGGGVGHVVGFGPHAQGRLEAGNGMTEVIEYTVPEEGMVVWVTIGPRFGRRQKLYSAIIDRVEVKPISELSPRDIERENPEFRTQDDVIGLLSRVYGDLITPTHTVTVIYFSRVDE